MPEAYAVYDTWLKRKPTQSSDLDDGDKIFVRSGQIFWITESYPASGQHLKLMLASPLVCADGQTRMQECFAYDPHIVVKGEVPKAIKLPVKHRYQTDNTGGQGYRECNLTSNTMLADYLLSGWLSKEAQRLGLREPEDVYARILAKYGDTTDNSAQTKALKELGIDSRFVYDLTAEMVVRQLRDNIPTVVGVSYKSSGHIILIVGVDFDRRQWLVHDAYGTRHGSSDRYDIGIGGVFDPYSFETMDRILWDMGKDKGWGRIVTAVKGRF